MSIFKTSICKASDYPDNLNNLNSKSMEATEVEGYKGLKKDMKSIYGDFQYEIGKTYYHEGPLELCYNGFHYCPYLNQTFRYCELEDPTHRYFKVKAKSNLDQYEEAKQDVTIARIAGSYCPQITTKDKCVTSEITLLEEVSDKELYEISKMKEYITFDEFLSFRHQDALFHKWTSQLCANKLKDKYSETFIYAFLSSIQNTYDRLKKTKIALGLYDENISPDMRAFLLCTKDNIFANNFFGF